MCTQYIVMMAMTNAVQTVLDLRGERINKTSLIYVEFSFYLELCTHSLQPH